MKDIVILLVNEYEKNQLGSPYNIGQWYWVYEENVRLNKNPCTRKQAVKIKMTAMIYDSKRL
jgi:hypothetical protein